MTSFYLLLVETFSQIVVKFDNNRSSSFGDCLSKKSRQMETETYFFVL